VADLFDVERYELYTGADLLDVPRAELLYAQAIAFLEGETHRYFGTVEPTEEYIPSGTGTVRLFLKEPPVLVSSGPLESDVDVAERRFGGDWEDVADYEVRGRSLVRLNGRQWDRRAEYRVRYFRGYDELPEDVEREVFELLRYALTDLARTAGVTEERIGDYSYKLADIKDQPWAGRMSRMIRRWEDNPA
jgi:hypothetical protein